MMCECRCQRTRCRGCFSPSVCVLGWNLSVWWGKCFYLCKLIKNYCLELVEWLTGWKTLASRTEGLVLIPGTWCGGRRELILKMYPLASVFSLFHVYFFVFEERTYYLALAGTELGVISLMSALSLLAHHACFACTHQEQVNARTGDGSSLLLKRTWACLSSPNKVAHNYL